MRYRRGNSDDDDDDGPKPITDQTSTSITLSVVGITVEHMREHARLEAAGIFNVPSTRVKVQLGNVHVASRDPFPTDLSTYARVDMLGSSALCILVDDDQMPAYERL